jgi:hypothetical protein
MPHCSARKRRAGARNHAFALRAGLLV